MEKFSTARGLSCACSLLAGLCTASLADSLSRAEHRQSPQPRSLPLVAPAASAAVDAWPQAIVLDAQAGALAEVAGADGGAQLFIAGQVLRVRRAGTLRGHRLAVYRPGPWLQDGVGGRALGRLAFRVARAEWLRADSNRDEVEAVALHGEREIQAGDLVFAALPLPISASAAPPPREMSAHVAAQRDGEALRFAAAGQIVALDRGALDGARVDMCLRLPGREQPAGRVLHVGAHAAAVLLEQVRAPLEPGAAVLLSRCPH
ncbi:hypothetical protein J8I26_09030 [Herbaspirillum sp. LeCh32-8]|uniref:hypothetical protein n=1 Tax=Herbaspirillum sp. LeCh32-8 TaxID=2821356 RepID=UPI001AE6FA3D|nr:hypothetical protein [Herbaspirillum sp. LeCh32-8]MBP0598244.1 hypothetical protein [Herbaspirillum sp. LeCh32-8]